MTNGHPPQGGQPPPEGYPQQGQPQQAQQWPQPQQPPPGGGYPQYPQQQGGYGQYAPAPNPYQSGPSGPRANFGQRLLANLLDFVIIFVPLFIFSALLGAFDDLDDTSERSPVFSSAEDILYTLIWLALMWSYYTFLEGGRSGQTIGKKALSIRVIRQENGAPVGYPRALGRNAVRGVPFFIPFIGVLWLLLDNLWMLWDREKQTLHDKATKTLVVPVAAYPIPQDYSGQQSFGQPQQTYGQQQGYGPPPSTQPPPQQPPPQQPPPQQPPPQSPPGGYNPNP